MILNAYRFKYANLGVLCVRRMKKKIIARGLYDIDFVTFKKVDHLQEVDVK